MKAAHTYQTSIGVDRQINRATEAQRLDLNGRGTNLSRSRDINAPIGGLYPYGDSQLRYLTESTGSAARIRFSCRRTSNYKKLFLSVLRAQLREDRRGGAAGGSINVRANGGLPLSATCGIAWWWAPAYRCRGKISVSRS